jgi:hypothetical protein
MKHHAWSCILLLMHGLWAVREIPCRQPAPSLHALIPEDAGTFQDDLHIHIDTFTRPYHRHVENIGESAVIMLKCVQWRAHSLPEQL